MNIVESGKVLGYYDFGMFVFALWFSSCNSGWAWRMLLDWHRGRVLHVVSMPRPMVPVVHFQFALQPGSSRICF